MTIRELRKELRKIEREHGNLDVKTYFGNLDIVDYCKNKLKIERLLKLEGKEHKNRIYAEGMQGREPEGNKFLMI